MELLFYLKILKLKKEKINILESLHKIEFLK